MGYLILVFFVVRLIVPHLGFRRVPIPESIPAELTTIISDLHQKATSNMEFLTLSYDYVTSKYTGNRLKTITEFWRAFGNVYDTPPGFLHCTGQNYLLRTMLIKSGRFTEGDVKVLNVPFNLFIHQYLKVKVDGKWINVDPWSHFLRIPFGKNLAFFG